MVLRSFISNCETGIVDGDATLAELPYKRGSIIRRLKLNETLDIGSVLSVLENVDLYDLAECLELIIDHHIVSSLSKTRKNDDSSISFIISFMRSFSLSVLAVVEFGKNHHALWLHVAHSSELGH